MNTNKQDKPLPHTAIYNLHVCKSVTSHLSSAVLQFIASFDLWFILQIKLHACNHIKLPALVLAIELVALKTEFDKSPLGI